MFINSTSTFSFFPMSDRISGETRKRKASEGTILIPERNRLPLECKATVKRHINSIYVGSIVRIYDKKYGEEGQLVTMHWALEDRLFVTLHAEERCSYVKLKYNQLTYLEWQEGPQLYCVLAKLNPQ